MLPFLAAARIQLLIKKNQIEVLHSIPGRIRLRSPLWKNSEALSAVVEELKKEPGIISVTYTKEVGSLLLEFDESMTKDYARIEQWMLKVDRITN